MGGDKAPAAIIEGAKMALEDLSGIGKLLLVGDESVVKAEMDRLGFADRRAEIVHASQVVGMGEGAVESVKRKKDSSMSVATDLIKRGDCEAVISAGNTGAAVATTTIKLRLLPGSSGRASPRLSRTKTAPATSSTPARTSRRAPGTCFSMRSWGAFTPATFRARKIPSSA